ncbi:hypothetical protein [Streptomyces nanshensis]|uniref:Uncharacterized protein n=1 Tax=Streptomyces nanshensis TaxID=518642 RepID=A0A1E7L198_9ACTN|nr:hypothetical protein [Streptomyces nanshensis]OEV09932.1 hypothetical protein AN218_19860 [Streptomyces nanshensis]
MQLQKEAAVVSVAQPAYVPDPRVAPLPRTINAVSKVLPPEVRRQFLERIGKAEIGSEGFREVFSGYYAEAHRHVVGSARPQAKTAPGSGRRYPLPDLEAGVG